MLEKYLVVLHDPVNVSKEHLPIVLPSQSQIKLSPVQNYIESQLLISKNEHPLFLPHVDC